MLSAMMDTHEYRQNTRCGKTYVFLVMDTRCGKTYVFLVMNTRCGKTYALSGFNTGQEPRPPVRVWQACDNEQNANRHLTEVMMVKKPNPKPMPLNTQPFMVAINLLT